MAKTNKIQNEDNGPINEGPKDRGKVFLADKLKDRKTKCL